MYYFLDISYSSLPSRQLRKVELHLFTRGAGSLPSRQLRNIQAA
ncbi:hypothetical protein PLUTE_b0184 [Pseudoalteromonas luteoviolacea DSM 6061]|nr:hypothetical protein [Pseudoalteromonas luteoviolacea DSM 6061]